MKSFQIALLSLLFFSTVEAQQEVWQTAIYASDTWSYMPGSNAIPNNWNEIGFDDSSWDTGPGSIGYGDGDDATQIDNVVSLYMRRSFDVGDKEQVLIGIMNADYDDAFIAYINGVEIARENINGSDWDQNTNGEHEAEVYQGGEVSSYLILAELADILVDGENVLAIQTHNANGLNSSDMTTSYWLSFASAESNPDFGPLPDFLSYLEGVGSGFTSDLPIVRINTNNVPIPNEPKIDGEIEIVWDDLGQPNSSTGEADEFIGKIRIEQRGQTSQFLFPKHNYLFEIVDDNGEDLDASFLNFPKEEDFILHGPYSDKTMMRNVLIFDIANKMGQYASRTRYVELVVNGLYEGIYVIMERIKRDNDRVDIAKLNEDDIVGDELTGGYIIKIDKDEPDWYSNYDIAMNPGVKLQYQYVYPRRDNIQPEQETYIQSYIDSFETVMLDPSTLLDGKSYLDFIDIESFVDHFLLVEFAMDIDAYRFSTYMHKDKDSNGGKLKCGPLWDFNLSFGNCDFCEGWNPVGYMYNRHCDLGNPFWWQRLMGEEAFRDHAKCRWQELRNGVLDKDNLFQYIDEQVELLGPALSRNYEKWPILNEYVWPNPQVAGSYSGEIDYLKEFIADRLEWMDNQLFGICDSTLVIEPEPGFDFVLSPNPVNNMLSILFVEPYSADLSFEVYDMIGQKINTITEQSTDKIIQIDLNNLRSGSYSLIITADGKEYAVKRFVVIN